MCVSESIHIILLGAQLHVPHWTGNWEDHFNASSNNFHDTWAISRSQTNSVFDSLFKHKTPHIYSSLWNKAQGERERVREAPKHAAYTKFNTENQFSVQWHLQAMIAGLYWYRCSVAMFPLMLDIWYIVTTAHSLSVSLTQLLYKRCPNFRQCIIYSSQAK